VRVRAAGELEERRQDHRVVTAACQGRVHHGIIERIGRRAEVDIEEYPPGTRQAELLDQASVMTARPRPGVECSEAGGIDSDDDDVRIHLVPEQARARVGNRIFE
jgi:hypothetical protein